MNYEKKATLAVHERRSIYNTVPWLMQSDKRETVGIDYRARQACFTLALICYQSRRFETGKQANYQVTRLRFSKELYEDPGRDLLYENW